MWIVSGGRRWGIAGRRRVRIIWILRCAGRRGARIVNRGQAGLYRNLRRSRFPGGARKTGCRDGGYYGQEAGVFDDGPGAADDGRRAQGAGGGEREVRSPGRDASGAYSAGLSRGGAGDRGAAAAFGGGQGVSGASYQEHAGIRQSLLRDGHDAEGERGGVAV